LPQVWQLVSAGKRAVQEEPKKRRKGVEESVVSTIS
jgi:hypothetical protein